MRRVIVRTVPIVLLAGFLALLSGQSDPIEKSAKSLLEAKCYACHGDVRMSDLDMRDRAGILKGGKRGPAVVPGSADASLLYKAVKHEGELQMPQGKAALTASEVNILRDWINAGARFESAAPTARTAPAWWSLAHNWRAVATPRLGCSCRVGLGSSSIGE